MVKKVRVAAVQFAIGADEDENLATCLRMIDEAATHEPELMVLPEFLNHHALVDNFDRAYSVAVDLDGPFLRAIGVKAAEHHCYVVVNCTVRRRDNTVTDTNILIGPDGKRLATSDKQVLIGPENDFLAKATELGPIVETPLGRIGMYSCMDGVLPETARCLALRGAQILCNTLNSCAEDEAVLHIPARAAENKVFVVAANKIGPIVPLETGAGALSTESNSDDDKHEHYYGAGESQIVAPDGTVLARAPRDKEGVAVADIDVFLADDKVRPDGTDIFSTRRPELYGPIAQQPGPRRYVPGADEAMVAVYQPDENKPGTLEGTAAAVADAVVQGAQLIVLPELFYLKGGYVDDVHAASNAGQHAVSLLKTALDGTVAYVATSIVAATGHGGFQHCGVLVGGDGVVLRQTQLHACGRHRWVTKLGDLIATYSLPWARIALIVGGDVIYPEVFRLAALQDVEVVAAPSALIEYWENSTGLVERGAENRFTVVAATRASDTNASMIVAPSPEFSFLERTFDGTLNLPAVTVADTQPGLTTALVHPKSAGQRLMFPNTDVVDGRPWNLLAPLLKV
ncbi:MAG: carbon-nitrogen hydrolase family protein [Gammaproteobacteria bacterium]